MFLGIEAIDEEGLKLHRKRVRMGENERALEIARELDIVVAVNIIADPDWDERRFEIVREWALSVPEIVHMTINTPYPGTETWLTESRNFTSRDYRLFDVQHAVLPTRLPLERYYAEFVKTQDVLNRKHLGFRALWDTAGIATRLLFQGQTNFLRMLWKFSGHFNAERLLSDHRNNVKYLVTLPESPVPGAQRPTRDQLYVHSATKVAETAALATTEAIASPPA